MAPIQWLAGRIGKKVTWLGASVCSCRMLNGNQSRAYKMPLGVRKQICGTDTFLRHRCVASCLEEFRPETILDVGGEGLLQCFIATATVVSANVQNADVLYDGKHLPFEDDSFDAVVSLDTVEHFPKDQRLEFLAELVRVAQHVVVLCAPLGTPEHVEYEKRLLADGRQGGLCAESLLYLAEHVEYGLPTPNEVDQWASIFSGWIYYQGSFLSVINAGERLRYLWLALSTVRNLICALRWKKSRHLKGEYCSSTNRFFLVLPKGKQLNQLNTT